MKRLIVNADDFGLARGVSEGILEAHRHGIVTSTTVLVNRPIARDLIDRLDASGLGVGLHLNLTLGPPLTRARSLTGPDGAFVRDPQRALAGAKVSEVEDELQSQVETFQKLFGRRPTHLDTHHHVGLFRPVSEVVIDLARTLHLPVRSQDEHARARARVAGLRTPHHFFGEAGPGSYWTLARTLARLRRLPEGCSEFMAHPGYVDHELSASRYGRQRETELTGVGSSAARGAAMALGIQLTDFRGLD
jgi:predicted glycoside hydrolase/deacetylase ChbG (UPF0249 family)